MTPTSTTSYARFREEAEAEVGRQYLEPASHRRGWLVNDEVAGRFVWSNDQPSGRPYGVVVAGGCSPGRSSGEALESYEGWRFRVVIEDRVDDARGGRPAYRRVASFRSPRS
jgi:hypothetical protein